MTGIQYLDDRFGTYNALYFINQELNIAHNTYIVSLIWSYGVKNMLQTQNKYLAIYIRYTQEKERKKERECVCIYLPMCVFMCATEIESCLY